jgi:hypothetical protein
MNRNVLLSIPDVIIGYPNFPNPSKNTLKLGSTRPLTVMSTRSLPWGYGRPELKDDKFSVIGNRLFRKC